LGAMDPGRQQPVVEFGGRSNSIAGARRLARTLTILKVPAHSLHAKMQQRQRLKALDRFRGDARGVLVATDVAARGLDIPEVALVVHFDVARQLSIFVHRAGRTARAGRSGTSLSLVTPKQQGQHTEHCGAFESRPHATIVEDPSDQDLLRKRCAAARKVMTLEDGQTRSGTESSWRETAAEEAGIDLTDEESDDDEDRSSARAKAVPKELVRARGRLEELLVETLRSERVRGGRGNVADSFWGKRGIAGSSGEHLF